MLSHAPIERRYFSSTTEDILDYCDNETHLSELELLVYELQFRSPKDGFVKARKAQAFLKLIGMYQGIDHSDKPEWPTTDTKLERKRFVGLKDIDWYKVGVLKASGYAVGKTDGKPQLDRIRVLNSLMLVDDLKDISNRLYAREFGEPATMQRLMKLANILASFIRNFSKMEGRDNQLAISDWSHDLNYLKEKFYDQWPNFEWPSTDVY